MAKLRVMLFLALLAACSAYGESNQVPIINGVPIVGYGR